MKDGILAYVEEFGYHFFEEGIPLPGTTLQLKRKFYPWYLKEYRVKSIIANPTEGALSRLGLAEHVPVIVRVEKVRA